MEIYKRKCSCTYAGRPPRTLGHEPITLNIEHVGFTQTTLFSFLCLEQKSSHPIFRNHPILAQRLLWSNVSASLTSTVILSPTIPKPSSKSPRSTKVSFLFSAIKDEEYFMDHTFQQSRVQLLSRWYLISLSPLVSGTNIQSHVHVLRFLRFQTMKRQSSRVFVKFKYLLQGQ